MFLQGGSTKPKYEEEEEIEDDTEDTDSEFEDPDTIEVPKSLSAGDKKTVTNTVEESDDDIEVISSTNNGSKFGANKGDKISIDRQQNR